MVCCLLTRSASPREPCIRYKTLQWKLLKVLPCAGELLHQHCGANKVKMEDALQSHLLPEENPLAGSNAFQRDVWHAKLGIS